MSLAIMPDLHDELKVTALRKGQTTSSYLGEIIEQLIPWQQMYPDDDPMIISKASDEDILPVVIKIPKSLKSDPEKFRQWMFTQCESIIDVVLKSPSNPPSDDKDDETEE